MAVRTDRITRHARPLVLSYWLGPMAGGLAVIIVAAGILLEAINNTRAIVYHVGPGTGIQRDTTSIKVHTADVAILDQVDATAKAIKDAAAPLTGQAAAILSTVGTIDATVDKIDASTGSIQSLAGSIDGTVNSIGSTVGAINGTVKAINGTLANTVNILNGVLSNVQGILNDTHTLLTPGTSVPAILSHVRGIDCEAAGSNCGKP